VHLTERFNGKEVFLVGTTNQSTMLAQRTQKLINEIQPDAVMVQTNEKWWDVAKMLQYVDSQQEFSEYQKHLDKYTSW
jgi:pheromone shutdown protein TraB